MRITFLGTGGAFTDFRVNYHNNALVETAEGPVLLDCGHTAVQSMRELGVERSEVAAVLFTHLHADHASPETLIFERYYSGVGGVPGFLPTRLVAPEDVIGPLCGSLRPFLDEFTDQHGEYRRDGLDAIVTAEARREVEIGGVRFSFFRVPHVTGGGVDKPAYGVAIDDGVHRVLWSGDTTIAPRWVREAADDPRVKYIFHECLFAPVFRGTVHTHWEDLSALPEDVQRRVTLMHYTEVPADVELGPIAGAARRHQIFEI